MIIIKTLACTVAQDGRIGGAVMLVLRDDHIVY